MIRLAILLVLAVVLILVAGQGRAQAGPGGKHGTMSRMGTDLRGLHQEGVAPVLVMSGSAHEVKTMKRLALEAGVPAEAIDEDPAGLNTYATVVNLKYRRVVAVSHYYHLARIKMVAGRSGVECYTSPCRMSRRMYKEPYFIFRECAALGAYYLFRG